MNRITQRRTLLSIAAWTALILSDVTASSLTAFPFYSSGTGRLIAALPDEAETPVDDAQLLLQADGSSEFHAASAAEIRSAINLREFPRIAETAVYSEGPTYVFYAAKGSVPGVDAFYRAELEQQGWKLLPSSIPESPQYADRLYQRNGIYLHLALGAGAEKGTLSVNISVMGNLNLTELPRTKDAVVNEGVTPVNFSFRSPQPLSDLADFCRTELPGQGWNLYKGFHDEPASLPYISTMTFFREAMRINVLVHRDPQKPAEPATVAMYSAYTIPWDLPIPPGSSEFQLDVDGGKAEYVVPLTIDEVPQFLTTAISRYEWQQKGELPSEVPSSVIIQDGPESSFLLQVNSEDGKLRFHIQRLPDGAGTTSQDEPQISDAEMKEETSDDAAESDSDDSDLDDELAREIAATMKEARGTIRGELGKLRNQLQGIPGAGKLSDLLEAEMEDDDDSDGETPAEGKLPGDSESDETTSGDGDTNDDDAFVKVAEDDGKPEKIDGKLVYDGKTIEMSHALIFNRMQYGEQATVLYLSDRPLKLAALKTTKLGDLSPSFDLSSGFESQSMQLTIRGEDVYVNCQLDSGSLSLTVEGLKNETVADGDRISGRIYMEKPQDFFDKPFQLDIMLNARMASVSKKTGTSGPDELVMDDSSEIPVPFGCNPTSLQSSRYRATLDTDHDADVERLLKLYTAEMPKLGWKEVPQSKAESTQGTRRVYRGEKGELTLNMVRSGSSTHIEIITRDEAAAAKAGMIPAKGKARLVLGNANDVEATLELDGQAFRLKAHEGEKDPSSAKKLDITPGKHKFVIKMAGKVVQRDEFTAPTGTTWGFILLDEEGGLVDQMY